MTGVLIAAVLGPLAVAFVVVIFALIPPRRPSAPPPPNPPASPHREGEGITYEQVAEMLRPEIRNDIESIALPNVFLARVREVSPTRAALMREAEVARKCGVFADFTDSTGSAIVCIERGSHSMHRSTEGFTWADHIADIEGTQPDPFDSAAAAYWICQGGARR